MTQNDAPTWPRSLSAATAEHLVDAAVGGATAMAVRVTPLAVDDSGVVKGMERTDGARLVSVQAAMDKLSAPVAVGMPTTSSTPSSRPMVPPWSSTVRLSACSRWPAR
jgi:uncharacterized protein GlcG (DUF336 family)